MIQTGTPAKETELAKKVAIQKVRLLTDTRDWLRGYIPYCVVEKDFVKRYKQILTSLTKVVSNLYEEAFQDWEPIIYLNNCLKYCNLNPESCVNSIKYCALYLESIYNDIVAQVEVEKSQQNLAVSSDKKEKKVKRVKEQKEDDAHQDLEAFKREIGGIGGDGI